MNSLPFFSDLLFEDESYLEKGLAKGEYDHCVFKNCDFQDVYLSNISFLECTFIDCQMSNCKVGNATFNEVTFDNCKLLGIHFFECNPFLISLIFKDCNLELASFQNMDIPKSSFENCNLNAADFSYTNLTASSINNCNLINTKFQNSILEKVDFRQSYNFQIDPENNSLKKAIFTRDHLEGLLSKYGIIIE